MIKFESKLHRNHLFDFWAHFILAQPGLKKLFSDDLGILRAINLAKKTTMDRRSGDFGVLAVKMECRKLYFHDGLERI